MPKVINMRCSDCVHKNGWMFSEPCDNELGDPCPNYKRKYDLNIGLLLMVFASIVFWTAIILSVLWVL
jgi:hypothetical protein